MITPVVTELPPVLQPVVPSTFIFVAVREGEPRPSVRRIVD
jgi:hypothetical protein